MKPLENLPPFYVGQKVVCVESGWYESNSVVEGKHYTISHIDVCVCGQVYVAVGQRDSYYGKYRNPVTLCCNAKYVMKEIDAFTQWRSQRFAPIQKQNFPLIKLSQIVEKEKQEVLVEN